MMALHVGPRRERALAGIVGYSGMLADPEALVAEVRTKPPVLLVHGDADPVLPVASLQAASVALLSCSSVATTERMCEAIPNQSSPAS